MAQKPHSISQSYVSSAVANTSFFQTSDEPIAKFLEKPTFNQNCVTGSSNIALEDVDPHLANWEKWINIHKEQQEKLSAKIKRKPECMVMNSVFNYLYINQDKKLITDAINHLSCDKYRGHPNYWDVNANFEHHGEPLAPYQTIQKRYDRSFPTESEVQPCCPKVKKHDFVGIPDAIYKEKGLSGLCPALNIKKKWDESEHVIRLKNDLKEKLSKIKPGTTDVAELIILGTSITKPEPFATITPSYCDSTDMPQTVDSNTSRAESIAKSKETIINVTIGDTQLLTGSNTWTVSFDTCILNKINEVQITIQNLVETVVRFSWEFIKPKWIRNALPLKFVKRKSKCFYFDKSDGVILPGSELNLVFNFISDTTGVFNESWVFQYGHQPDEWFNISVELLAVAVENEKSTENLKEIDSYIEACTRYTIARKTVEELLKRNNPIISGVPYDNRFLEEEIFAYNNPELFYKSKEVYTLKQIHLSINNKEPWDYSVKNLREKLLHKSLDQDVTNEIELYSNTVSKLMKSNLSLTLPNEKTKSVYELLCCFVNKLEAEGQRLMNIYKIPVILNCNHDFATDLLRSSLTSKVSLKGSKINDKNKHKMAKSSCINLKSKISKKEGSNSFSTKSISTSESTIGLLEDENYSQIRRQEYLEALYIKSYHYLGQTLEQISSVIDSFDFQKKTTALNALKNKKI